MNRVILDITELVGWRGKLTGVPRVMSELATRFQSDHEVTFAAWDNAQKVMYEIGLPVRSDNAQSTELRAGRAPHVERIKQLIRRSPHASRIARSVVGNVRALQRATRSHQDVSSAYSFRAGDTLVVLADWHGIDSNFVAYVQLLHTQGVHIIQFSYDLLPIIAPQYSGHSTAYFTHYTKSIYPLCDVIIADSQNTKRDIETWLATNKLTIPSIAVVRLGDDFQTTQPRRPQELSLIGADIQHHSFLLCVGTVEARKNHTVLYYAYKLARRSGVELPPIVLVGRKGWLAGDLFEIASTDPDTKQKIIFLQNTPDDELEWLYQHCLFTVYPSFYEGWGLPVAESLARGIPCLCSDTSSIPEIAGDLADYFDPASPDDLLAGMKQLLDERYLQQARKRAKAYETTTWNDTYQAVKRCIIDGRQP